MKAAVYDRYGPPEVVRIEDVEKPVPQDREVLVRVRATTVCAADWRLRRAKPFFIRLMTGLAKPKTRILGMEFAGTVEAVGKAVARFRVGEDVFGGTGFRFGSHAEYVCVPEDGRLAAKPANMTFEEAAAVLFGGFTALHFLRKARIAAGQEVLVYGASGSVGVFAVQLAKYFGARVTAVCSTVNLEMVKSLGADAVVDYTREDFSKAGRVYDLVFDTVGASGFARTLRCLKRGGPYVRAGATGGGLGMIGGMLRGMWVSLRGAAKVIGGVADGSLEDQLFLKGLIEEGNLRTVIDRCYPLARIAEGHRLAEGGHKKGHVVVVME
ncbi:MAG TPA: NAD(P)-dependent alcohol dehydrogenase [Bryobacteraceae bacterium]|nr:NAD(P)-dependent alcohol dehydrogenase [Bryobacteraceae bacterium]